MTKVTCELCGSQFFRNYELNRHIKAVHGTENEDSDLACADCNLKFTRKDSKYRHDQEKHCGNNVNIDYVEDIASISEFTCSECNQTFRRNSALKRHIVSVHNNDKIEYQCTQCEAKFSRKDSLNQHMKTKHM